MCILSVYTLLKVVGYYDLSVLSMTLSVMGFQNKVWMGGGWVGGVSYIQCFFGFFEFLTLQNPLATLQLLIIRSCAKVCG